MNKVILMGRLTRDPDVRYTDSGLCVARYTLAVDRRRSGDSDEQKADFPSCIAFGKTGEFAQAYLHKGSKICIDGRLQTGSYTNRDGVKVYTTDVVVNEHYFAESKAAENRNRQNDGYDEGQRQGTGYDNRSSQDYGRQPNTGQYGYNGNGYEDGRYSSHVGDGFMDIPEGVEDEGLPFN